MVRGTVWRIRFIFWHSFRAFENIKKKNESTIFYLSLTSHIVYRLLRGSIQFNHSSLMIFELTVVRFAELTQIEWFVISCTFSSRRIFIELLFNLWTLFDIPCTYIHGHLSNSWKSFSHLSFSKRKISHRKNPICHGRLRRTENAETIYL